MPRSLAGTRIREVRRRAGMTQTALAREAGISPSYLNLIEHNRRAAAGKVLTAIAAALNARPAELSEGNDAGQLAELREAVAPDQPAEPPEEFIGRFPYWARQMARLFRQTRDQGRAIAALSDRLTHDPYLSENIHGMLTRITAIRSTASILSQANDMPEDQKRSFHQTIHAESIRLSNVAEALAKYLGGSSEASPNPVTAEEAFDQFLSRHDHYFEEIDVLAEEGATWASTTLDLSELTTRLANDPALPEGEAREMAARFLAAYSQDALDMPLEAFARTAKTCSYDPIAVAEEIGRPLPAVLRRLATLKRPKLNVPAFGLIVSTASGHPLYRRPLPGFPMPRHGNACTLWPLFVALSQPGRPLFATVVHDNGQRFATVSVALPRVQPRLNEVPDVQTSMLVVAEGESPFTRPSLEIHAGTSCRLCSRRKCPARSESPVLGQPQLPGPINK
jgi:XRE family transcriptional regulator, fatty acid utilization regulator